MYDIYFAFHFSIPRQYWITVHYVLWRAYTHYHHYVTHLLGWIHQGRNIATFCFVLYSLCCNFLMLYIVWGFTFLFSDCEDAQQPTQAFEAITFNIQPPTMEDLLLNFNRGSEDFYQSQQSRKSYISFRLLVYEIHNIIHTGGVWMPKVTAEMMHILQCRQFVTGCRDVTLSNCQVGSLTYTRTLKIVVLSLPKQHTQSHLSSSLSW